MVKEKFKRFHPMGVLFMLPSAPMHVIARIPVTGYTPGQSIDLDLEVDNKSSIEAVFSMQFYKVSYAHDP